jgi:hypothetical protein
MQHQKRFIQKELEKYGKVSRNKCLKNYISRLGMWIKQLEEEGYVFDSRPSKTGKTMLNGRFEKTRNGMDYVYYLVAKPNK